jgi:hypothetical protein
MTNEERDLISQFVARVGGNAGGGFSRSVPSTQPALPPIDPEADRFIAEQFQSHPEARYRITQMAVVQEAALAEAANRIQRLQADLQQAQQQAQQASQQAPQQSRGFLGGLFGGGQQTPQPPQGQSPWNQGQPQYAPPPQPGYAPQAGYAPAPGYAQTPYPPNTQPGMFQRSGSGFLGSALTTAAGVAGGVVAGNVLMDMFSGHSSGGGGMFGGGGGGFGGGGYGTQPTETIINNNYGDASQSLPVDPSWDNSTQGDSGSDSGWGDSSSGDSGGGFDDNSL